MNPEFDNYAKDYAALLTDPIRDWFAQAPEFYHRRKWLLLKRFLSRRGAVPGQLRWLDVGCGKGELLHLGMTFFEQAAGCDPSSEMLKECAGLMVKPQSQSDVLPFDSESFDLVTAVCVYHHLNEHERQSLSKETFRVLKPGGVFGIIEHNPWNPLTRGIVRRAPVDANAMLLSSPATRRIMQDAGLKPVATKYFLYFPAKLYTLAGGIENLLAGIPMGGQYAAFAQRPG